MNTAKLRVQATPAKYLADTVVYLKNVPGTYAPRKKLKTADRSVTITAGKTSQVDVAIQR